MLKITNSLSTTLISLALLLGLPLMVDAKTLYFTEDYSPNITVYDTETKEKSTITLSEGVNSFIQHSGDNYAVYNNKIVNHGPDWLQQQEVCTTTADEFYTDLVIFENILLVSAHDFSDPQQGNQRSFKTFNKNDCTLIDSKINIAAGLNMTVDHSKNKILFYTTGKIINTFSSFEVDPQGNIINVTASDPNTSGSYNTKSSLFNGSNLLVSHSGILVDAFDGSIVADLKERTWATNDTRTWSTHGRNFIIDDSLVVQNIEDQRFELYSTSGDVIAFYEPSIKKEWNNEQPYITSDSSNIYVLSAETNELETFNLASFNYFNQAVNASAISYTPESLVYDNKQDLLYILSSANGSIFRWSLSDQKYLSSISIPSAIYDDIGFHSEVPIFFYWERANRLILKDYYIDLNDNSVNQYPIGFSARGITNNFVIGIFDPDYPSLTDSDKHLATLSQNNEFISFSNQAEIGKNDFALYWSPKSNLARRFTPTSPCYLESYYIQPTTGEIENTTAIQQKCGNAVIGYSENGNYLNLSASIYQVDHEDSSGFITKLSTIPEVYSFFNNAWINNEFYHFDENSLVKLTTNETTKVVIETYPPEFIKSPRLIATSNKLIAIYNKNGKPQFNTFEIDIPDSDGDGYLDNNDAFPQLASEWLDSDFDGIGNNTDEDIDGDGVINTEDFKPTDNLIRFDSDNDGISNFNDPDDDNDGFDDENDFYPTDPSKHILIAKDFLPFHVGSKWSFTKLNSDVSISNSINIAGKEINPVLFPSNTKFYFNGNNEHIELLGFYLPNLQTSAGTFIVDARFNQALNLTKLGKQSGTATGSSTMTWEATNSILSKEIISLPSGVYNTIHFGTFIEINTTVNNVQLTVYYRFEMWLAEGVGIVKYRDTFESIELESYNIAQPSDINNPPTDTTSKPNSPTSDVEASQDSSSGGSMALLLIFLVLINIKKTALTRQNIYTRYHSRCTFQSA